MTPELGMKISASASHVHLALSTGGFQLAKLVRGSIRCTCVGRIDRYMRGVNALKRRELSIGD